MPEKLQENLQQKQPQKNSEGKKLLLILLVVLCWLFFITGLLFTSSKCSKATNFTYTSTSDNNTYTSLLTYDEGTYFYNDDLKFGFRLSSVPFNKVNNNQYFVIDLVDDIDNMNYTISLTAPSVAIPYLYEYSYPYFTTSTYTYNNIAFCPNGLGTGCGQIGSFNLRYLVYDSSTNTYTSTSNKVFSFYVQSNGLPYLLDGFTPYILSTSSSNPFVSGGGFTQADLDEAYADGIAYADGRVNTSSASYTRGYSNGQVNGYQAGVSAVTTNPDDYNLYTSTQYNDYGTSQYNAGVTQGESNVTTNPDDYNLYTSTQYNDYGTSQYNAGITYADGRVNTSSASYTAGYTAGLADSSSYQDGYDAGRVYVLTYVSDHGGNGVHHSTYTDEHLQYQLDYIYTEGQLSIVNEASSYQYGSSTVYTRFQNLLGAIHIEMNNSHSLGFASGRAEGFEAGQLSLLNYSSGHNGSGTVYSSYSLIDYDNELALIYSNGSDVGADVGYSGGYTAGVNSVLGNLSYYDLYSKNDYDNAITSARTSGYSSGYQQGKLDYENVDVSLPNTIISIASVPLVVLTSMFNFEVLGVNLFALITSILSLLIAIWVIKKIAGK